MTSSGLWPYSRSVEAIAPSGLAGKQIDHYALETLVATTTVCSIYRGRDVRTGRQVALKIPHPEVEGDLLFYGRFCREQEIARKLNHPGIVEFLAGEKSSKVYLAMEWVEGKSLRVMLSEQGRLPAERALRIATGICEAIEHIHSQGVVHRDLKPENVMVDAQDRVKLIDFGVASLAGSRRLTFGKLSQVMGTPDYISPEQVQGKRGDERSDLYALGVMLYEMLTGTTPFPGDNVFAIMNSRLHHRPIPPREVNPDISRGAGKSCIAPWSGTPRNAMPARKNIRAICGTPIQSAARIGPAQWFGTNRRASGRAGPGAKRR